MGLTISVAATVEPLTVGEVKVQLSITDTAHDTPLTTAIKAARKSFEMTMDATLTTTTLIQTLDFFPHTGVIFLNRPPLQSVTSITYVDDAGDTQTWDSSKYDVDITAVRGRIMPAHGELWPSTRAQMEAVAGTVKAGYGDSAGDVPEDTKQTLLMAIDDWFLYRGAQTEVGVAMNETFARLAASQKNWSFS